MILEQLKTIDNKIVTSHSIVLENGIWTEEKITHTTVEVRTLNRAQVRKLVRTNMCSLTDLELESLKEVDSVEAQIENRFLTKGFTLKDVERWCYDCYTLELDPLPEIKRISEVEVIECVIKHSDDIPTTIDMLDRTLSTSNNDYISDEGVYLVIYKMCLKGDLQKVEITIINNDN